MSTDLHSKSTQLTLIERIIKYITLLFWGGPVYYCIELLWRGYSHPSMFVLGGICFLAVGALNNYLPWKLGFIWQVLIGTSIVIALELIAGLILNVWLGLGVWDYSNLRFNLWGQISLLYFGLFMPCVALGIWLDDFLRWKIWGQERPRYTWFGRL